MNTPTLPMPPPLATIAALQAVLDGWAERGWLRGVDAAFARFLAGQVPDAAPLAVLAAAFVSHQAGRGHTCLDLAATLADSRYTLSLPPDDAPAGTEAALPQPALLLAGLRLDDWQAALRASAFVDADTAADGTDAGSAPLVLRGGRLALRRYWQHEREIRAAIDARLAPTAADPAANAEPQIAADALRPILDVLFPPPANGGPDHQALACALAARSRFAVITGGPGTGKTTTVLRLLACLQALALRGGGEPQVIRLAAPTGKAAARLNASISGAVGALALAGLADAERIRAAIPTEVTTLHRLLGTRPDSRHFRHDRERPLPVDVLVVDEASMIDLELMAATLAALPDGARLILLGDRDQLASVEAGALLGELCARAADGHWWPDTAGWLTAATGATVPPALIDAGGRPLDQAIAMLRVSHRFGPDSGIGRLAAAVNAGNPAAIDAVLDAAPADVAVRGLGAQPDDPTLAALLLGLGHDGTGPSLGRLLRRIAAERPADAAPPAAWDAWASAMLAEQAGFQLLCALRRGRWGVEGLNARIETLLRRHALIAGDGPWYAGRPVLVTGNDYGLNLMNGDLGLVLPGPPPPGARSDTAGPLRAVFPGPDGRGVRWLLPLRLQAVETAYALTVHKSQGSEFAHAALLLPDRLSPILTRELVYTGITRARQRFTLLLGQMPAASGRCAGDRAVLHAACGRRVQRASGLLAD